MADKDPKRPSNDPKKVGGTRPSVERAMALRDVLTHAVEVEKETRKKDGPPKSGGRSLAIILSVPALVFSVYSFVVRPEFIWGPSPKTESIVRRDANLRFTMFLLSQRIRYQHQTTGKLPASLADVRENPRGISYAIVSDTVFELRAIEDGQSVVLRSDQPTPKFLGDAQRVIMGRGR